MSRRATLAVRPASVKHNDDKAMHYVRLVAGNGEPLLNGETHPSKRGAEKSRDAILTAMREVLEDEGYVVKVRVDDEPETILPKHPHGDGTEPTQPSIHPWPRKGW